MSEPVTHSLVQTLRRVPAFSAYDDHTALMVVGASANLFWPAGTVVIEKGAPAEALYILLTGGVRVFDAVDGQKTEVRRLGPGDYFGERALLLDTTVSKSVETIEDSELLVLPKESFEALVATHPELGDQLRRRSDTYVT